MSQPETLTPDELLATAEKLFETKDHNMYRAAILEAVTALEAQVKDQVFPTLKEKLGEELTKWLEEKTRMDFETRLGLFIPLMTGLEINKKDKSWEDYKKSKVIRNRVTHSGFKVSKEDTRFVIDTMYEWIVYLNQAQEAPKNQKPKDAELLGSFIQASARLEKTLYSERIRTQNNDRPVPLSLSINNLKNLLIIDDAEFEELHKLRELRNKAVHGSTNSDDCVITEEHVVRLNLLVDKIADKISPESI